MKLALTPFPPFTPFPPARGLCAHGPHGPHMATCPASLKDACVHRMRHSAIQQSPFRGHWLCWGPWRQFWLRKTRPQVSDRTSPSFDLVCTAPSRVSVVGHHGPRYLAPPQLPPPFSVTSSPSSLPCIQSSPLYIWARRLGHLRGMAGTGGYRDGGQWGGREEPCPGSQCRSLSPLLGPHPDGEKLGEATVCGPPTPWIRKLAWPRAVSTAAASSWLWP